MDAREGGGDMGLTLLLLRLKALNPTRYALLVEGVSQLVTEEERTKFAATCLYDILSSLPPVESAT